MTAPEGYEGVIGLHVPGVLAYRYLAIRLVSTACQMALLSDVDGEAADFEPEVISAVGEAFNNVVLHGYAGEPRSHDGGDPQTPGPAGQVWLEVEWDARRFVVTMVDSGNTFDPASVAPPDLKELPDHGMGLFIMARCMDEIDYHPGPPNVLRLVKLRRCSSGVEAPGASARCGRQNRS